jgi:hypothetical protein
MHRATKVNMTRLPKHERLTSRVTPGIFCVIILPFIVTLILAITTNGEGAFFSMGAIICGVLVIALGIAERSGIKSTDPEGRHD